MKEKTRLQSNLQNLYEESEMPRRKLQHVPTAVSEEPYTYRQGKRDSTHFSYSQDDGL